LITSRELSSSSRTSSLIVQNGGSGAIAREHRRHIELSSRSYCTVQVYSLTRRREYPSLLAPLVHLLPPSPVDEPLTLTIWTEDNAFRIPSGRILAKSRELAKRGLGEWKRTALPWGCSALLGYAFLRFALPLRGRLPPRSMLCSTIFAAWFQAQHCHTPTCAGSVYCRLYTYGTQGMKLTAHRSMGRGGASCRGSRGRRPERLG
jgi:hypothetical protein